MGIKYTEEEIVKALCACIGNQEIEMSDGLIINIPLTSESQLIKDIFKELNKIKLNELLNKKEGE